MGTIEYKTIYRPYDTKTLISRREDKTRDVGATLDFGASNARNSTAALLANSGVETVLTDPSIERNWRKQLNW